MLSSPVYREGARFLVSYPSTTGHTLRKSWLRPTLALGSALMSTMFARPRRLVTIAREEGPAALYKGFVPKVLRLAPGGGVLLLVVEFTLNVFRQCASFPLVFSPSHDGRVSLCVLFTDGICCSPRPAVHLSASASQILYSRKVR